MTQEELSSAARSAALLQEYAEARQQLDVEEERVERLRRAAGEAYPTWDSGYGQALERVQELEDALAADAEVRVRERLRS